MTVADLPIQAQLDLERRVRRNQLDVRHIDFNEEGIRIAGASVDGEGLERLSSMLEIPSKFVEKCTPALGSRILREFLGRKERQIDYLRDQDEGAIVSFAWQDYFHIPTEQILNHIVTNESMQELGLHVTKAHSGVHENTMFITEGQPFEVITGDRVYFGVNVLGSMDGSTAHKLTLSFFRPTCTNGAYINEGQWTFNRRGEHGLSDILATFSAKASEILVLRHAWMDRMRQMAGEIVEEPERRIIALVKQLSLPSTMTERILAAYREEPNPTQWGIMNAFTRAANGVPRLSQARDLWAASGDVIERGATCRYCGHELDGSPHNH